MTKESKKYRIYDKTTKHWYEIPENQYREYDRWRTALRKRMQYRGKCFCPRANGGCATATASTANSATTRPFLLMIHCLTAKDALRLCAG